MLSATVRVVDAVPDPLRRDRLRRWLVSVDVLTVVSGELPEGRTLSLLVHSPSRDFQDADVVGNVYRLTLSDPVDEPYTGRFSVEPT